MIRSIHSESQIDLTHVGDTDDPVGLFFGAAQCRKEHARQYGYDGNDNQQFDQGESMIAFSCFEFCAGEEIDHDCGRAKAT